MGRPSLGLAILLLFCSSPSIAQTGSLAGTTTVPPIIRFNGALEVAAGHVRMALGLFREETGGDPLWLETQLVSVDSAGRYQVVLGATAPLPFDLFASGEARWLDVAAEGIAPQPRRLLVSVPYALKAVDADTIGGKPLSAFVLAGERTGVGADGLAYVDTRVLSSGLAPGGAGTANYVGVFTDTTTLGNSVIYQTPAGSVGINTTTPAAGFHSVAAAAPGAFFDVYNNALGSLPVVYRTARGTRAAPAAVQANDILGGLAVRGYGTTTWSTGRGQIMYKAAENWTDSAQGTYLQLTTTPIGTGAWAERMRITPDGRVGIGTATPAQALTVAGIIESTAGGLKFPDGSVLTTATGTVGNPALLNTAVGSSALAANTTGYDNAASGYAALAANTTGYANTASGYAALYANTTGYFNTASGYGALSANTTGYYNTASGSFALAYNTTGSANTAAGHWALGSNTTGYNNTASGYGALSANTTGYNNTASGESALGSNTTGSSNTASGNNALHNTTTGVHNVAVGSGAGLNLTTGNYNIAIGNSGVAAESNTMRIGTSGTQTRTFVAGIRGVTTGNANAVPVLVDTAGQLGTVSSSRRVKDDIADMADASSGLMTLRPVTFHYKSDQNPTGRTLQYGLIAEEVAVVYPGLVAHSADGDIETVMYQFLPPMLLNEVQKQRRTIESQQRTIDELGAQVALGDAQTRRLAEQVAALTQAVAALRDQKQ